MTDRPSACRVSCDGVTSRRRRRMNGGTRRRPLHRCGHRTRWHARGRNGGGGRIREVRRAGEIVDPESGYESRTNEYRLCELANASETTSTYLGCSEGRSLIRAPLCEEAGHLIAPRRVVGTAATPATIAAAVRSRRRGGW